MTSRLHALPFALCALLVTACGSSLPGSVASPVNESAGVTPAKAQWFTYERAADYPGMVTVTGLQIPMSDGINLSASVALPADDAGTAVPERFPVVLTQTGYNKSLASSVPAFPTFNSYLVQRGYAHVAVDVRGTGASEGNWEAFSEREQQDYKEVMDWVATQDWSNGSVGTWGPSFMGITQIFTAAWQHPAHKAVFAIVPDADAYRDIVFAGGQVNAGFIPLWMGLVTALGVIPAQPDAGTPQLIADHIVSALTDFQVPIIAESVVGANGMNYDGPFWRTRSPIEVAPRVKIPTFIVGGLNDLFQRGEPMLYEALKGHTTTKLLIGPWMHLTASSGAGLPLDNVPDLNHIALMWFDRYLRGAANGAESVPNVTQYLYGEERYSTATDWPHPQAQAQRWYLHGDKSLSQALPAAGESSATVLQEPVNGICSTSTNQWTAGLLTELPSQLVPFCFSDNRLNEALLETPYTSAVMDHDYYFNGPIEADMWIATTASNASLLVRVTDVAPGGASRELTNGILTASLRAVDNAKSRKSGSMMLQPWHPFTAESELPVTAGEAMLLPIEIFPTSSVIKAGHQLRITVSASDFPHGLPPLTAVAQMPAGVVTLYSDADHPSSVVLPVVPVSAITMP